MTTPTTRSLAEFAALTPRSGFSVFDISHLAGVSETLTNNGDRILFVTGGRPVEKRQPKTGTLLADVVREMESTVHGRQEMAEARQWAGESLYKNEPQSLQALRLAAGFSQADLASRVGTQQYRISIYERGLEKPAFDMLCRLADALRVSMDTLRNAVEHAETRSHDR